MKTMISGMSGHRRILTLAAIVILISAAFVSASQIYEYSFKGYIGSGSVDIDITPYEESERGLIIAADREIMPGDRMSYIPRVSCLRESGYVRVRVMITMDRDIAEPVTTDNVYSIGDNWVQRGEYFYNTDIMHKGESSDVFRGLHIPETWTQDSASGFTVKMVADIIQDENFTPDFENRYPWGSVETEASKSEDRTEYRTAESSRPENVLNFSGDEGFESSTEDLMASFGTYMAGDSYEDSLVVRNSADRKIHLMFRTDSEPSDFLEQMELDIYLGEERLYHGNLVSGDMSEWIDLCDIDPGDSEKLRYYVHLPDNSRNCYTVLDDDITWMFRCEMEDQPVITGEHSELLMWISLLAVSVILICLLLRYSEEGLKL